MNVAGEAQLSLGNQEGREERPLLSIITATRNAAATLQQCIDSVRSQEEKQIEHLIIDAVSEDGTIELLERNRLPHLRWISEPDKGIYDAWNKGIRMARGEWIAFLGADDRYLPGAIGHYRSLLQGHPEALYLSSRVCWIDRTRGTRLIGRAWKWPRFQRYMCTAHVGSWHHRSLFESFGVYDASLRIVGDYEFLLRPRGGLRAAFMPEVTVEMMGGGTSDSVAALYEAAMVKQRTGGRAPWLTVLERYAATVGFQTRMILGHIRSSLGRQA